MTVLVTGASGFIGSFLAEKLVREGEKVRLLVRRQQPLGITGEDRCEICYGDIADIDRISAAFKGVDTVYHLAAELRMGLVSETTMGITNVLGTTNVIECCRRHQVSRLVYCSSVGVLGDTGPDPRDEASPPAPEDPYEISKYAGEKAVLAAASADLSVVVVRPAWVYGPRDRRTLKLFRLISKGRMFLLGKGMNRIHPVFVSDVVEGIFLAGTKDIASRSVFHLAGPRIFYLHELLSIAAEHLGVRLLPLNFPLFLARGLALILEPLFKRFGREAPLTRGKLGFFIKNRAYAFETTTEKLGYRPLVDLEDGLDQTFSWYRVQNLL